MAMQRMKCAMVVMLFFLMQTVSQANNINDDIRASDEKELIKTLITNYEKVGKIGRPVKNTSEQIRVQYGLSLFQILSLDERSQILTINAWTQYTWRDQLLKWEPRQHQGLKEVRIPSDKIWTPDIVLYNYADERLKEHRDVMVTVDYKGGINWNPPAIFKSTCRLNILHFPFDKQVCFLRFASWTSDGAKLDLDLYNNTSCIAIDEYTLIRSPCLLARLERNSSFFAYLLVLPCVLLTLLNLVIFWLPPQVPAKMILGMNIFVAFSLLLRILSESTPSASTKVPLLGYYYCLNMILISLSTFFSMIVINLHFRCDKRGRVPAWMATVVTKMSKLLRLECNLPLTELSQNEQEQKKKEEQQQHHQQRPQVNISPFLSVNGVRRRNLSTQPPEAPPTIAPKNATKQPSIQLESNICEIRDALHNLILRMENKDKNEKVYKEWHTVALVLDRTCFYFYLVVMLFSLLYMLFSPDDDLTEETLRNTIMKQLNISMADSCTNPDRLANRASSCSVESVN